MTEKEQFQSYRLMPPWRRWLIIAFGLLLPVFFGAVGCSFIVASHAPLWAMAIGLTLGLGWGIIWSTSSLFAPNSGKMRSFLGSISAAMLFISLLLTAEWAAIPRHPVSVAFTAGYVFSYAVGLFIGILSFNAVVARIRA
jgi:hypothetical protein